MSLMASTALPTAPISSPRCASAICASMSPFAMRWSTDTRLLSGRLMPKITMEKDSTIARVNPTRAVPIRMSPARLSDCEVASRSVSNSFLRAAVRAWILSRSFARIAEASETVSLVAASMSPFIRSSTARFSSVINSSRFWPMPSLAVRRSAVSASLFRWSRAACDAANAFS